MSTIEAASMSPAVRVSRTRLPCHVPVSVVLAAFSICTAASPLTASGAEDGTPARRDHEGWRTDEFGADWGLGAINADAAYARGLTGKGVRLGIFDTGTAFDHPEFHGKNLSSVHLGNVLADGAICSNASAVRGPSACFSSDGGDASLTMIRLEDSLSESQRRELSYLVEGTTYDPHGTFVAGVMVAGRDGNGRQGVAFGADLVSARRVFSSAASFYADAEGLIRARGGEPYMDATALPQLYTQLQADGARALNNSWSQSGVFYSDAALDKGFSEVDPAFVHELAQGSLGTGIIQVWAAGNSTHNPSPDQAGMASVYASLPRWTPGLEAHWLSVVSVDQRLELDSQSYRCGASAHWCIAAPGRDIHSSTYAADTLLTADLREQGEDTYLDVLERVPRYGYMVGSGTSVAAPHVTGALGLLFERFPYLDNAQVRDVLLTTATDLGAPGVDDVYGWGLLNLEKAIDGYGALRVDTNVMMDSPAGGRKVWEGGAWDDWRNDIGGPGRLGKYGGGWLRLSGHNSFNGAVVHEGILELDGANALTADVQVEGGQLRLNGSLVDAGLRVRGGSARVSASGRLDGAALTIDGGEVTFNGVQKRASTRIGPQGRLQGVGQLGDTIVEGLIAPGDSSGRLTINGNYVQQGSGTYLARFTPDMQLHVTGSASLDGRLTVTPVAGRSYLGDHFRVLQADAGVHGIFATTDFSAFSPFLKLGVDYDVNGIDIDVTRGQSLASAATTANQRNVAAAADRLPIEQGLPRPLTMLFPEQVGPILDELSGELHAATSVALVDGSRYVRNAALSRAIQARSPQDEAVQATGVWVQAIGGSGRLDGTANTARIASTTSGLLAGIDHEVGGWQLGALLGNGRTDTRQVQGRGSKARVDNKHVGLYAANSWGRFGLRGGATYTRHELDTSRQVAFTGYHDTLTAHYRANTIQTFIEGGYRLGDANAGLEPYLQLARVNVTVDAVREQGGAAALRGTVRDTSTTLASAGVRFNKGLKASFQQDAWLNLVGGVGYRRTAGDRDGMARLAFEGGEGFIVRGAPLAGGAILAELGLSAWLSPRQQVELGYAGQFGRDSRDQSVSARWSWRF